jgi:hypothetical protein
MKAKAILLCLGLIAIALGAQDTVHLARNYKQGDKDSLKMKFSGSTQIGDLAGTSTVVISVDKVYDNGDADVTSTLTELKATLGGNEVPVPPSPPRTERVDKNGNPTDPSKAQNSPFEITKYMQALYGRDLKVGDTFTLDKTNPDKSKISGTVKLDSIADGMAKFVSNVVATPADDDHPTKLNLTAQFDVATSKLVKAEGDMDYLKLQGLTVTDVKVSLERVKS